MKGPSAGPVTVAYILPRLEMGGTEKHVRDLVANLDRRRYAPLVIATSEGGVLEAAFRHLEVPVYVLGYKGLTRRRKEAVPRFRDAMSFLRTLVRILREERVAIVHAYLPAANVIGALAGRLARTPRVIVSKRGLCRYKKERPILAFLEDVANLAADAVTVNSHAVGRAVREAERFCALKIHLIYNGIDPGALAAAGTASATHPFPLPRGLLLPDDASRILCVANFFPYKGHADLVEAASRVVLRFPAAYFLLAGRDSGALDAVSARIEELGLGKNVLVIGERDDVPALLRSASFLVHPSHEEGFSNTILEAMAAGKAVVATKVGGVPEAVLDGKTGLLVPAGDPEMLAERILSLLRDPEKARTLGDAGRQRVLECFSLKEMVRETEEMYERILQGGRWRCAV